MATLWNKGTTATGDVERFTVGNDRYFDLRLAKFDVQGSKAHIAMLCSVGLLSEEELNNLNGALDEVAESIDDDSFVLEDDVEDIHSQIELILTDKLGDVGKKIHSGRSRNDQVLVDLKLFMKDELLQIRKLVLDLFSNLQSLSEKYREVILPGYTHLQIAMPSSFGMWFGAYAEALVDDMQMLAASYRTVDRNPLGSGAGYGGSFPLDREMTTRLLGFASPVYNSVACQMGRGKCERNVASALGSLALTLNKFSSDCCLYMCPNFGFIRFPDNLTTGSSIMPHKKNPDVWEIMRGKTNRIIAAENGISLMCSNLQHGYHRDYQLFKEILFPAFDMTKECLAMASYMLGNISVNESILDDPVYEPMFSVEEVNRRTLSGVPFRDAYRQVGIEISGGKFRFGKKDTKNLKVSDLKHTHLGSIGYLCNDKIAALMDKAAQW